MMNTSRPRAFSFSRTKISPSANRDTVASVRGMSSASAISSARGRFAVPERSIIGP